MNRFNLLAIASLSSLLFLPSADAFIQSDHPTSVLVSSTLSSTEIRQLAQAITVRVLSIHQGGSGILIKKQGQTYTILTNAHVVNFKGAHRIQTPDGKTHSAIVISRGDSLKGNDLALLQFNAKENYRVVPLATTANSSENQEVSAAGFPFDSKELVVSRGKISLLSPQPLVGGYQIGYTNEVQQGMSGGPLLNLEGKLIGVNGLLNKAILNDAYVYQNGSRLSTEQLQHFKQLSFAVPIQTLAQIAPHQASILTKGQNQQQASQQPVANNIVDKVNNIAEKITVRIDSKSKKNDGSGVIIAHTGQTYYVVTALHVVKNSDSYKIVTPDGQQYALQQQNIIKPERTDGTDGTDAALLKFSSNKIYSVATIAKHHLFTLNKKRWVFLSGFPENAGGKRKLTSGSLFSREKVFTGTENLDNLNSVIKQDYGLIYSNLTQHGMSGGPVLDSMGQVIGINAAIEPKRLYHQRVAVELGLGRGVPSSSILSLATKAGLKPELLKVITVGFPSITEIEINSLRNNPLFAIKKPSQTANEYEWLNYGNQLWRLERYSEAVSALQQAINFKHDFHQAYYALALALYSQKKDSEALAALNQATNIKPDYDEAWSIKSEVLENLKKYSEALAAIDEAIKYNDKDVNFYVTRGFILTNLKRYPEAIAALTKAINVQPQLFTSYNLRGNIRQLSKDYQAALADFDQAIKLESDYAAPYRQRGILHNDLHDYQSAIADCNQAIKLEPDNAYSYSCRGNVHLGLQDFQQALLDYNQAIKLGIELGPDSAAVYASRGNLLREMKEYKRSLEDFNQAIKLDPDFTGYYQLRSIVRFALKDQKGAMADLEQAMKLAPDNAFSYSTRGEFRSMLKDDSGAQADYSKANELYSKELQIRPNALSYVARGGVRKQLKDPQRALADYTEAIKLQPKLALAYTHRGLLRDELKDYRGAIDDCSQAITLQPNDPACYLGRSFARTKLKDYTGAIADYDKVIILLPNNAIVYSARADVHSQLKDYTGAIADYTQVIKLLPNNPQGYFSRGVVHHKLRDYTASLSDYNQAIAKNEKFWEAITNIGYIKYEKGDVQGAISQWQQSVKINSNAAEPQMAMAVALYTIGEQQLGLNMAQAALRLDKSWADVKFLKENLWGDRLVADAQKLLSHPSLQTVRSH